jgi:Lipocalin-like domain
MEIIFSQLEITMKPFVTSLLSMAAIAGAMTAFPAQAQTLKDQIVGTWSLVSNTEEYADGTKVQWGPDAKGSLIFNANGEYSLQIGIGGRAPAPGNPADNPVGKFIAYFGTYSTSDADKTIGLKIVRGSFPGWDGTEQKRVVVETGDQMIYKAAAPIPSAKGPFVPVLVWKRIQ